MLDLRVSNIEQATKRIEDSPHRAEIMMDYLSAKERQSYNDSKKPNEQQGNQEERHSVTCEPRQ